MMKNTSLFFVCVFYFLASLGLAGESWAPGWIPPDYCNQFQYPRFDHCAGKYFLFNHVSLPATLPVAYDKPNVNGSKNPITPADYKSERCKVLNIGHGDSAPEIWAYVKVVNSTTLAYMPVFRFSDDGPDDIPFLIPEEWLTEAKILFLNRQLWSIQPLAMNQTNNADKSTLSFSRFSHFTVVDILPGNKEGDFILKLKTEDGKLVSENFGMKCKETGDDTGDFNFFKNFCEVPPKDASHSSQEQWDAILAGRVLPGMTRDQVYLSLGPPARIAGTTNELWEYNTLPSIPALCILQFNDFGILEKISNPPVPTEAGH
jgi:hypothetical protein